MADASYDVVVIGGGHNALITSCYLAANGLSVAVFERAHELGGGTCSEELPLPGFVSIFSTKMAGRSFGWEIRRGFCLRS